MKWILLNRAPTSTQLYSPPPSSNQPHSPLPVHFNLHLAPSTSTRLSATPVSLQQYLNQNIACNSGVFPNLRRKVQSCPFWLKISIPGILEVLIPNPDLEFWNSNPNNHFFANLVLKKSKLFVLPENWYTWYFKDADFYSNISFLNFQPQIPFWANFGQKNQSCPFFLKIGTHGICRMLILIPTLVF